MIAEIKSPGESERLKLRAFSLLAAHRQALIRRARRALLLILLDRERATIDEVRGAVPTPAKVDPTAFGPVPSELATLGIIAADGYQKSARPEAHARPVQIWKLVNRAAALHWLATHPEIPEPEPESLTLPFPLNKEPGAATPGI